MRRRSLLVSVPALVSTTGCLGTQPGVRTDHEPLVTDTADHTSSPATGTSKPGSRWTSIERTADGVEATFRVTDGHRPTDDTATASVDDGDVVVEGTMDPYGCDHPVLDAVSRDGDAVRLVVATESRFGETATVECGNASYDFQVRLRVADGTPATVTVVYHYGDGDERTFGISL